jgi:hypothetical protein
MEHMNTKQKDICDRQEGSETAGLPKEVEEV